MSDNASLHSRLFLETFDVVDFLADEMPGARQVRVDGGTCSAIARTSPIEVVTWPDELAAVAMCTSED